MEHWHYIYEVVMTDEQRFDEVPSGHIDDNGGLVEFQAEAIHHDHEIFSDHPDGTTHTHLPNLLMIGN